MKDTDSQIATIAARWESRPERLADVIEQVREIRRKLLYWGFADDGQNVSREQLDLATICYSRACASYECCEWLPFDLMPGWEDDLYCLLLDEDRWHECREANRSTTKLAAILRAEVSPASCSATASELGD